MPRKSYVRRQTPTQANLCHKGRPLLGKLDLELTERCNNNCIHCCINLPANDLRAQRKELSSEEIKNILKEAASLGCLTVKFTGGEPLLRKDFEDIYLFSRRLGLRVLLFTNATLITPRLASLFRKVPPLKRIEVTVYGMKKSSYEAVTRVPGSFEAAWRGIYLLLKKKIPFVVKGALLPANKNEMKEFEEWAATIPEMERPPSYSMFFDLHHRRDSKKNKLIKNLRITPQDALAFIGRRKDAYFKEMKEFCAKFIRPPGGKLFSCGAGQCSGCVDAYGFFQPCLSLRHPDCVYNLRKSTLKEALTSFPQKLRKMKAVNSDYLKRCAKCFLKGLCEQCPAKSWMEHGTLDTPVAYLCEIGHTKARYLGLLKPGEKAWEVPDWQGRIDQFVSVG